MREILWKMGIAAGGQCWETTWIGTTGPVLAQNNRGVSAGLSTVGRGESSCVGITISGVIPTFHTLGMPGDTTKVGRL